MDNFRKVLDRPNIPASESKRSLVPPAEITSSNNEDTTDIKQKEMNATFRMLLNKHRKKNQFTDLTIVCGNNVFPVHKVILSSGSSYFQDLFLMEKEEEPTDTVALQGIDHQVMDVLLDFIYSGNLSLIDLPFEKVSSVFSSSIKLGVFGVQELFVESMSDILNRLTFRPMLQLADKMANRRLVDMVFEFILSNLSPLISADELQELCREHFLSIMDMAIDRQCPSEMILQAVLSWVKVCPVDRRDAVRSLLANVRLDDVSEVFARFLLEDEDLLKEYPRLKERLQEIASASTKLHPGLKTCSINNIRQRGEPISFAHESSTDIKPQNQNISLVRTALVAELSPRCLATTRLQTHDRPCLAVVGRDEANRASIMFYSIRSDEWSPIEDMGLSLEYKQGLAFCDDLVFFIGGEDMHGNKLTLCYVRDLLTKETKQLADLRIPRSGPKVLCWRGAIHAVGGVGRYGNSLSHVERLDSLRSSVWRNVQPLREKRDDTAVVVELESRFYVLGGGTHKCEFFQPASRTWHELPALPIEFGQLQPLAAAVLGHLYAFNYYKPQRLYQLAELNSEWKMIPARGVAPEWVTHATGWRSKIFTLDRSLKFFIYDVRENTWTSGTRVPRIMPHPSLLETVDIEA
uniref:BTB domain-containing protein n=1 Tax=Strigamia maritima TaxID=126957 RepID=T1J049_STRMM